MNFIADNHYLQIHAFGCNKIQVDLQSSNIKRVLERVKLDDDHDIVDDDDDDLQSSDNECVPERVKLGAAIVQHSRQPGVQSL